MTNRTSALVTALCNQPEAFASDLGDDQSRYLYTQSRPVLTDAGHIGLGMFTVPCIFCTIWITGIFEKQKYSTGCKAFQLSECRRDLALCTLYRCTYNFTSTSSCRCRHTRSTIRYFKYKTRGPLECDAVGLCPPCSPFLSSLSVTA